jgi:hypothetical protein
VLEELACIANGPVDAVGRGVVASGCKGAGTRADGPIIAGRPLDPTLRGAPSPEVTSIANSKVIMASSSASSTASPNSCKNAAKAICDCSLSMS